MTDSDSLRFDIIDHVMVIVMPTYRPATVFGPSSDARRFLR